MSGLGNDKYPSDIVILAEISSGNLKHFDVFVDRYAGRLISYFRSRIIDSHIAEDLSQESLMRVFRAAQKGQFKDQGKSTASWIFTIAHNCMVEYVRSNKRRPLTLATCMNAGEASDDYLGNQPSPLPGPIDSLVDDEHRKAVIRMLDKLPENQQEVVRLKIYGGLTFKQISELQGCPLTTVKSRMCYALDKMHQMILSDSEVDI